MTKEEKIKLAEMCGYELKFPRAFFTKDNFLEKCPESELFFIHPERTNRHFEFSWWNPEDDANQFEDVLFGASRLGICVRQLIGVNNCTGNDMIEADIWKVRTDTPVIELEDMSKKSYKNLICKAVLKALEGEG